MITTPGTWRQVLKIGTTAVIKPRADAIIAEAAANPKVKDIEMSLVDHKDDQPPPYSS